MIRPAGLALVILHAATSAAAGGVEVNALGGYRFGGFCFLRATGQVLWQGEVRAGLVLRFP